MQMVGKPRNCSAESQLKKDTHVRSCRLQLKSKDDDIAIALANKTMILTYDQKQKYLDKLSPDKVRLITT